MRHDPQLQAVLSAYRLPIERATWAVDGTGCRPEVTQLVCDDLGLPPMDKTDDPGPARRRGVIWTRHLREALAYLVFGHAVFERRYEWDADAGLMRLAHLGGRMPWTIATMSLNHDGTVDHITQTTQQEPLAARRLAWYCNELEGSSWVGKSKLRPAFGPWLLKHEMWRVLATSGRRFGMGVPTVYAPQGASGSLQSQVAQAQQLASAMRVGDQSGVGLPAGFAFELAGLKGSVPNIQAFIEYLDGQMSKMALAGLIDMPMAAHGSKALGETVLDLFLLSLQSVADDIATTATSGHDGFPGIVSDLVDVNWGEDEPCPRVVCTDVGESHELTANAIGALMQYGALQADPNLDSWIRKVWKLPQKAAADTGMTPTELPSGSPESATPPAPAVPPGTQPGQVAAAGPLDPGPVTHRELTPQERQAGFDPEALHRDMTAALGSLMLQWPDLYAGMRRQVTDQVAAGKLGSLKVSTRDAALALQDTMASLARQAAQQMITEAAGQGVLINPDRVKISPVKLGRIADARAAQIGAWLASAATRVALQVSAAQPPASPADAVGSALDGLSQRSLADQLHGALMAAQNAGRIAAATAAPTSQRCQFISVEVMDQNTCEACAAVDGSVFLSAQEAEDNYPGGGYFDCAGFDRCRGTVCALWGEE